MAKTPGIEVSLAALPTTRRQIVETLKRRGEASVAELSTNLRITAPAVRRHLTVLESEGLVRHQPQPEGPGRPTNRYVLTAAAEILFPKRYSDLTNELLGYLEEGGPELVPAAFERRRERRATAALARLEGRSFDGKVEELTRILDEDGYLAEAERVGDGFWRVTEHNCAILGVATRYGQACTSEIAFLREALPEATVERVTHMIAGAHMCSYEIKARPHTAG